MKKINSEGIGVRRCGWQARTRMLQGANTAENHEGLTVRRDLNWAQTLTLLILFHYKHITLYSQIISIYLTIKR